MKTLIGQQAEFIHKLHYEQLPADVVQQAKECILDTIGCVIAGMYFPEIQGAIAAFKQFDQQQDCLLWCTPNRAAMPTAILINSMAAHSVEMDDVHKTSKTHTGAVVVPLAMTLGEYYKVNGQQLITALVAGYESALRVGTGINASAHRLQGWHATGTCCTFGAAATTSKILQLDKQQTAHAMGMAGLQSSGLWALTMDGANCKKLHMGHAAQSGLTAALLAKGGMSGPGYIIEAEDGGLFKAASSNYDFASVVADLGAVWEILKVDRKPYACCRSAQPPIDAILALRSELDILTTEIDSITVKTYEIAVKQCFNTKKPANVVEAQLCIPYTVAVAWLDGAASAKQFTEQRIQDPALLALADKVDVVSDPVFTARYPQNWGCELVLRTTDGREYSKTIPNAKGDAANPLTGIDLIAKFKALTADKLTSAKQDKIIELVNNLESCGDVSELAGWLAE